AIDRVASVASFFVSRVDTEVDRRLDATGARPSALRGKIAIANARLAYAWFRDLLDSPRWRALAASGAKPQRLLWASTGTKDPAYSDVLYVDSLIGADTINTLPPQTLQLFEDHGTVREALPGDAADAQRVMDDLRAAAIDFGDVARVLEGEGIEKFAHSFETLLGVIAAKRETLVAAAPPRHSAELRAFDQAVAQRRAELEDAEAPRRSRCSAAPPRVPGSPLSEARTSRARCSSFRASPGRRGRLTACPATSGSKRAAGAHSSSPLPTPIHRSLGSRGSEDFAAPS